AKVQGDFGLGKGEAEAIVLALAEKAAVLGIDDKNGINACKLLGVAFTTAIGILMRMCEKKLLTASEALDKLNGWHNMGVTEGQFWKVPGANWRQRHDDEDNEYPNGSRNL